MAAPDFEEQLTGLSPEAKLIAGALLALGGGAAILGQQLGLTGQARP